MHAVTTRARPHAGAGTGTRLRLGTPIPSLGARWWLAGGLVVLNAVDLVLSRLAVRLGATELNPLMEPLLDSSAGAVLKTLGAAGLALALLRRPSPGPRLVAAVVVFYAVVLTWNTAVIAAASG